MSTVQVRIQAINTGFGQARAAFGKLQTSVGKLKSAVFNLKTAFAAAGIGIAIKKVASESIKFEDALLDLQKVMSDTDGDAKQFTGTVKALSDRFGVAASEVLQGAANFKQAGFTIKESFELQELALRTATISQLSVAESSALVIRALKGFKAPASEAARLIDIMNEVSNNFATSLRQLGVGMADVSPVAEKMGFSFEETSGILTTMIEVFQSGSEAATAFNFGLIRLISSNKEVTEALHDLDVEQKEIVNGQEQMRKGSDIFFDVQKAFLNIAESEKLVFTQRLGGIRQTAKLSEIYDGLAKTTEITAVAQTSFGSSLKEMNIRLAAASTKLASTWQAFNNMAKTLGDVLMPSILAAAAKFKEFFRAMQEPEAIENFKRILSGAKRILGAITEIVKALWGLLIAFPVGVIDFFKGVSAEVDKTTESVAGLNKELEDLEPPDKNIWQLTLDAMSQNLLDLVATTIFVRKTVGNYFGLLVKSIVDGIIILGTEFNTLGILIYQIFTGNFAGAKETFGQFVNDAGGFGKQMASDWLVATANMKKNWTDMIAELHKSIPPDAPGPQPGRLIGPPRPPPTNETPHVFKLPETELDKALQRVGKSSGGKVVAEWQKAMTKFKALTDSEMEEAARIALEKFQAIEKSGKLTGRRLGDLWSTEVGPKLVEVYDRLDADTQELTRNNNKRFEEMAEGGIYQMSRLEINTRAAISSMKGPFTDFFDTTSQGFLNMQSLWANTMSMLRRKAAEAMADKAIKVLMNMAFPGSGGLGGGGGKKGIFGLGGVLGIFHEGGVVGSGNQPTRQLSFAGVPRMHGGGGVDGGLRSDEGLFVGKTGEGVLSNKGMDNLDKLNLGNAGGDGQGGLTVLAPVTINLNAIDPQSGVAFMSRPENLEVIEGFISQAAVNGGARAMGLK